METIDIVLLLISLTALGISTSALTITLRGRKND